MNNNVIARETPPAKITTRDRILEAAILRFARQSYEATGLRDIAADVDVDVAYVHRCFGSKERLFAAAVEATLKPELLLSGTAADLAATLAHELFHHAEGYGPHDVRPLDIVIHSLSSADASRVLRDVVARSFIEPLAAKLGHADALNASLITALLAGTGILRTVLGIAPLQETEGGRLEAMMTAALAGIIASADVTADSGA
ncbi:TetR family transcriptional regulator [Rhodopseudomonas sp. AAP120]|uniref:TetR/AcrR family transcriptional regulator n=1 Tax=Rhodopseudomonas sp. AAP120 TaxID=1523430 RepID=UPI0006CC5F1D|nr:TetR family transcriptional regulator [Rhodopseudomonas sp. AAP120]KPF89991.1 TetR family transcriptional regulator [Rhodopseudomonas sp. AAP120]